LVNATLVKKFCEIRFQRSSVGKNLLKDHRSYVKPINDLLSQVNILVCNITRQVLVNVL